MMKRSAFLFVTLLTLLLLTSCTSASSSDSQPSAKAKAYLTTAIDFIEQHSVMKKNIDWSQERLLAFQIAQHARTTADTYPAIRQVLEDLGDHHSSFRTPQEAKLRAEGIGNDLGFLAAYPQDVVVLVYVGSAADHAGIHVGDTIEMINGEPAQTLSQTDFMNIHKATSITMKLKHKGQAQAFSISLQARNYDAYPKPRVQELGGGLDYIELFQFGGRYGDITSLNQYATLVQQLISNVDQANTCGWVVDLRRNPGGSSIAMLAGLGPILGEGQIGSSVDAEGYHTPWFYHNGQVLRGQLLATHVDVPYHLKRAMPPVAVLTSQFTGSAAEEMVVAFRGRPNTSSFGSLTAGVPTGNDTHMLSDGAEIILTESFDADRTGQTYDRQIPTDNYVETDWTQLDTPKDPVLQAATKWLHAQKGCRD